MSKQEEQSIIEWLRKYLSDNYMMGGSMLENDVQRFIVELDRAGFMIKRQPKTREHKNRDGDKIDPEASPFAISDKH